MVGTDSPTDAAKKRVLIVDDDRLARLIMSTHLGGEYEVDEAESARQALDMLGRNSYALMVSDIMMPGESGMELLSACRQRHSSMEVILATASPSVEDAVLAMKTGAYEYLAKPFNRDELLAKAKAAIEHGEERATGAQDFLEQTLLMARPEEGGVSDDYRTIKLLGAGTNGIVLLVEREGVRYAMKILRYTGVSRQEDIRAQMLIREAEALSGIDHPNIVKIHELGMSGSNGVPFIVMEYVEGRSLKEHIDGHGLNKTQCLNVLIQLTSAVGAIHAAGTVHRDLKPANVLVSRDLVPKIADFGVSYVQDVADLVSEDKCPGTPYFMAPEQFTPRGDPDKRSDIYSLGVIGYELFTGVKPFGGATIRQLVQAIRSGDREDISAYWPDVPDVLCDIIDRMMCADVMLRYQDCAAAEKDLLGVRDLLRGL